MPKRSLVHRALVAGAIAHGHADSLARRALSMMRSAIGGALSEAMTIDEQSSLAAELYEAGAAPGASATAGLFSWEGPWFLRRLPPAPARVLVGAAGAGREATWLARAGYVVDALEPSASGADRCRRVLGGSGRVCVATYQDLAAAVLDSADNAAGMFARASYDAVLAGWGSLSHLLREEDRSRLVRACDRLCPTGPILASFLSGEASPSSRRRAESVGRAVGAAIATLRGNAPAAESHTFAIGFVHVLTREEIESLAAACGRRALWEPGAGYAHVTLIARATAQS